MTAFCSLRSWLMAATFAALASQLSPSYATDAPAPRVAGQQPEIKTPVDLDLALINEIKTHTQLMKNLQYLSDVIGGRLTGSKNLDRASHWTEAKMKEYGLVNVHLEPWEIPVGWERGFAHMKMIEPATGGDVTIASYGWSPGTKGKVIGEVVVVNAKSKADLEKYKGKLKNAIVLTTPPSNVKPVTDLTYPPPAAPGQRETPKKEEPKKEELKPVEKKSDGCDSDGVQPPKEDPKKTEPKKDDPKKDDPKKDDAKKEEPKKDGQPGGNRFGGGGFRGGFPELREFLKTEGVACTVTDSAKPHGLLNMTGNWPSERGGGDVQIPRVFMVHEHYAMLYRLATQPDGKPVKVELEIENKFIPGPITVYNTVGEVRGTEKPDEVVVVGAHLDSWDLGSGTTDNGTGSCVVLETARAIAALAAKGHAPKRTIRFVLFTGEEEGLWGSKRYVERHKDEMDKHSAAIVHDTGTGRVTGLAMHNKQASKTVLEPELKTLATIDGWKGMDVGSLGGTDHLSFLPAGVPGFAFRQDTDEYRLTHHSQSDTFDKAKEPNLLQGAEIMAVTAMRIANLPEMLPRK